MTDHLETQKAIAAEHIKSSWPVIQDRARSLASLDGVEQVVLCGCGDSHHAALGLSMGFAELAGIRSSPAHSMAAARYLLPQLEGSAGNLLVIAISASGEVARTIEALEIANLIGARTLALTGNHSGSLARTAEDALVFAGPELPHGPGLISYLTSLLMGYAVLQQILQAETQNQFSGALEELQARLPSWIEERWDEGARFADRDKGGTCVFLGAGPAYGSALFGAAKLIEASGEYGWGQDVEEWAHLEYFCAPAEMRTWLLSASGRSASRELEVRNAAHAIGRSWHEDRWDLLRSRNSQINEVLSPLALWAGPCGYAARRTAIREEIPFRNFGGGRDREEGGGASRIRTSERWQGFDG